MTTLGVADGAFPEKLRFAVPALVEIGLDLETHDAGRTRVSKSSCILEVRF